MADNKSPLRIVINLSGGNVQEVLVNDASIEVLLINYAVEGEDVDNDPYILDTKEGYARMVMFGGENDLNPEAVQECFREYETADSNPPRVSEMSL